MELRMISSGVWQGWVLNPMLIIYFIYIRVNGEVTYTE